ncbi:hypothetical protein [Kibdelosporangium phytohabitans]|uniref:Uncharacterized protein n=1 Tax=Kibdelosporangium phytohabitans TaxID=860235 RepID=A0A0N9IB81_9PSEU|nr:hypothetical protein [Kibdelosporangium phytohabitans]ALG13428.1 hypothetical protein AOZ06_47075 [Kibdelosporangium phytohabitans]MBE1465234.1 hypothetical protein [Kibdelosporangium phytohabitans]
MTAGGVPGLVPATLVPTFEFTNWLRQTHITVPGCSAIITLGGTRVLDYPGLWRGRLADRRLERRPGDPGILLAADAGHDSP